MGGLNGRNRKICKIANFPSYRRECKIKLLSPLLTITRGLNNAGGGKTWTPSWVVQSQVQHRQSLRGFYLTSISNPAAQLHRVSELEASRRQQDIKLILQCFYRRAGPCEPPNPDLISPAVTGRQTGVAPSTFFLSYNWSGAAASLWVNLALSVPNITGLIWKNRTKSQWSLLLQITASIISFMGYCSIRQYQHKTSIGTYYGNAQILTHSEMLSLRGSET